MRSFASTGDNNIQRPAGLTLNHTASFYTDVTVLAAMLAVQHTSTVQAAYGQPSPAPGVCNAGAGESHQELGFLP